LDGFLRRLLQVGRAGATGTGATGALTVVVVVVVVVPLVLLLLQPPPAAVALMGWGVCRVVRGVVGMGGGDLAGTNAGTSARRIDFTGRVVVVVVDVVVVVTSGGGVGGGDPVDVDHHIT